MPTATEVIKHTQDELLQPLTTELKYCWTVIYRHGVNSSLSKNFYFKGTTDDPKKLMIEAIERAQKHCGVMGYKYNFLRPMLCNIDIEEGIQLGTIDSRTLLPRVV